MSETIEVIVHEIAVDGLPDMDALTGRVAFIFKGKVISGWPLIRGGNEQPHWEANDDLRWFQEFAGVTHWVEFPVPVWDLAPENDKQRGVEW